MSITQTAIAKAGLAWTFTAIGFGAALGFACLTAFSRTSDDKISARALEIVDEQGRARIVLGKNPMNGLFGVYLYNAAGAAVGQLGLEDQDKPFLFFKTSDGSVASQLVMSDDGTCRLDFLSPGKAPSSNSGIRASIGVGELPAQAPTATRDHGFIEAFDTSGKPTTRK